MMAQLLEGARVPLLATIVLLLDDEAETIGVQLIRMCHTLDPLVQSRLRILRVKGTAAQLFAAPVSEGQQALVAVGAPSPRPNRYAQVAYESSPGTALGTDIGETRPYVANRPEVEIGSLHPFEIVLRNAIQQALSSGGPEPLDDRGYTLVPNELAVYIVGRTDSAILAQTASLTQDITSHISEQTSARRYAMLLAAPPTDNPAFAASNPGYGYGTSNPGYGYETPKAGTNARDDWQTQSSNQPWRDLLVWKQSQSDGRRSGNASQEPGEPPLRYAFIYEAWDETSRYHWRNELYYAMAESLFALFATGMLEHPDLKDALDSSSISLETGADLTRIGSIGTSLVTAPTQGMLDYLAHRLAADVLLRRGLVGSDGGFVTPDRQRSIDEQARFDAEHWINTDWNQRLAPDFFPLPRRLPPRQLEGNAKGEWTGLALSKAGADPTGLYWRWGPEQSHFYLNDERYWNLTVQNEYETIGDANTWKGNMATQLRANSAEVRDSLLNAIRLRALGPEGVERARAFAQALSTALTTEARRLDAEDAQQTQQLDLHHRQFEDRLRVAHPSRGVPDIANPPARPLALQMPRNIEALAHEVIDQSFERTPLPLTLALIGVLLAVFGAFSATPFARLPFVTRWPLGIHAALSGTHGHLFGAGAVLVLYAVFASTSLWSIMRLRNWQRTFAQERTLLWMSFAKQQERIVMRDILNDMRAEVVTASQHIDSWVQEINQAATGLASEAEMMGRAYGTTAALSRDLYVSNGVIWEGGDPNDLYLQVRQQLDDTRVITQFLQYVQAHGGDVIQALRDRTIGTFALTFMRDQLRNDTMDHPFFQWSPATAQAVFERALQAASVPLQPQMGGQPLGHFEAIVVNPSVAWVKKMAQDRGMAALTTPSDQWLMAVRVTTRAKHALVR